nr:MAK10-like protein [Tanacetum cinerariifolium]
MKDENPIRTLEDYSKPSHEGYRNTIELPIGNNVVPLRSDTIWLVQNGCSFHGHQSEDPNQHLKDFLKLMDSLDLDGENKERARTIDQSAGGKLRDHNAKEYWALLKDLALYYNESCNDPRDFAKPVKAITLPQDVPSTFDRRLIKLETQGQRLVEAHLGLTQPTQVNKITTSCEICNYPHDTQYCMEYLKQAFVDYASSRTDEAGGQVFEFMASQDARLSKFEADFKQQQSEMTNKIDTVLKAITDRIAGTLPSDTVKNPKLCATLVLSARSYPAIDPQCSTHIYSSINAITIHPKQPEESQVNEPDVGQEQKENVGEVMFIEIIRDNDKPQNGSLNEGRVKEMHVFVGNFIYVVDFMIVEDISSIIDPSLSQVVLGRPFIKVSNMTHDLREGVVRFTNVNDEVAYKMPHKIEQYNSLSNLEKEHKKLVYLRNEEDKRRGVDYVMSKILGFYKECLELDPEYVTGLDDEGEDT